MKRTKTTNTKFIDDWNQPEMDYLNTEGTTRVYPGLIEENIKLAKKRRKEMTKQTQHTPLPWKLNTDGTQVQSTDDKLNYYSIAQCLQPVYDTPIKSNASFICKAVNSHYKLIALIQKMSVLIEENCGWNATGIFQEDIKQALKQAEGG